MEEEEEEEGGDGGDGGGGSGSEGGSYWILIFDDGTIYSHVELVMDTSRLWIEMSNGNSFQSVRNANGSISLVSFLDWSNESNNHSTSSQSLRGSFQLWRH